VNPTDIALAVLLGGGLAGGLLLVLSASPRWRARGLTARLAPYLRDVTEGDPGRAFSAITVPVLGAAVPTWEAAADRLSHIRASWQRSRAVLWALLGAGAGAALATVVALAQGPHAGLLALPLVGATGAAVGEQSLRRAGDRARGRRLHEELPVVLEFLALCLSAGEGLLDALRRVGSRGTGELAAGIREVVVEVGTGSALTDALLAFARREDSPALSRAIDQLVAAVDRGTPLADVLHAHAADARAGEQRELIEQAGRKEIAMLVPLVFLILPVSVLFAIFPGVVMLDLG
jgi:tight adherence protein C